MSKKDKKDYDPLEKLKGFYVEVKDNDVEFALKKLKRMQKRANFMLELQEREYYRKPSEIRREKKHKGRRRKNSGNTQKNV